MDVESLHVLNEARLTKGLCLGLLGSSNCQEINAAPLNSANEMSALLNTRLMASPERCLLSERADNSITAGGWT